VPVAGEFGDADSVRRLGQALQAAGRGLNAVTSDLSGQVAGLVPSGWYGSGADRFSSDWNAKAGQAAQLAAVCGHVGGVLTDLARKMDAANTQAARAQQMTGGPAARFALPSTEQQSQQVLSRASGAARQAQAAARTKLAGIAVPRIGSALTASQVDAWAQHLAPPPKPSGNWLDQALHDVGGFFSSLFGSGNGHAAAPPSPLSNATSFVQISPHVQVPANDPKLPELKAAWAWASKRPVSLSGSPGDTEFTRWRMIFTVSPWASDLGKGQLYQEFGSAQPDFRIGGEFNQHHNVILSTAGMGAAAFLADPRSLVGASKATIERLVPEGWSGPNPLRKGLGVKWADGKGNTIQYEEGNPNARDLGQLDSMLHRGPYVKITQNGYEFRIALEGNPALRDSDAATISIKAPDGTTLYINETIPEDMPGDEAGGEEPGAGDGAGDGGAPAGE
jgi:uncharacterized protein YukE